MTAAEQSYARRLAQDGSLVARVALFGASHGWPESHVLAAVAAIRRQLAALEERSQ